MGSSSTAVVIGAAEAAARPKATQLAVMLGRPSRIPKA
jgi:hypothetical protein